MKALSLILFSSIILFSCSSETSKTEQELPKEIKVKAVNVYNYSKYGLPVLENINDSKSRVTYIQLGEKIISSGVRMTDSIKGREYLKIELSDGTTGWSLVDYIIENSFPVAITEETAVYERPDITTKSNKKEYDEIDLAVVIEEKDNWYKVVGINNRNQGWINKKSVSTSNEDITMTVLVLKEIMDKDGNIELDKIKAFIDEAPFPNSKVTELLATKIQPDPEEDLEEIVEITEQDSLSLN